MTDRTPPIGCENHDAAHNLESSEGQGAHPRTPSRSDAAARPEATLPGPESVAATARATEHRARKTKGWTWNEDLKDFVDFEGLALSWRFVGERVWRKHTLIPKGDQTIEGLRAKLDIIVARMAEREAERAA